MVSIYFVDASGLLAVLPQARRVIVEKARMNTTQTLLLLITIRPLPVVNIVP